MTEAATSVVAEGAGVAGAAEKPKARLPRKTIQVTYPNGDTNSFDSIKAASDATGHSSSLLLRLAATGEADENGDKYTLVDYVTKVRNNVSIGLDDDELKFITDAAAKAGKKVGPFASSIVKGWIAERAA